MSTIKHTFSVDKYFDEDSEELLAFHINTNKSETLNIFLRAPDEANLFTNLFSVMAPHHFRDSNFFDILDESFLSVYLCPMMDIVPSIPPRKYKNELINWKHNWKKMIKSIYEYSLNLNENKIGKNWFLKTEEFIINLNSYLKIDSTLDFALKLVQKDLSILNKIQKYNNLSENDYFANKAIGFVKNFLSKHSYKKVKILSRSKSLIAALSIAENIKIDALSCIYSDSNVLTNINRNRFINKDMSIYSACIQEKKTYFSHKIDERFIIDYFPNDVFYDEHLDRFIHRSFNKFYHLNFFKYFVFI